MVLARHILFLLLGGVAVSCRPPAGGPAALVDPFIGTGSDGHTFPGPVYPFGMVQPGPDTRTTGPDYATGYHYRDSTILGFSHLRYSGTGRGAGGDVLLVPLGDRLFWSPGPPDHPEEGYRSRFSHHDEEASPGYYRVYLRDAGVTAELTAGRRVALHRYTWHHHDTATLLLDLVHGIHDRPDSLFLHITGPRSLEGCRRSVGGLRNYQTIWFAMTFSAPFLPPTLLCDGRLSDTATTVSGKTVKALLRFPGTRRLEVKVALSRVDMAGARNNLHEADGAGFDKIRRRCRQAWNNELGRITIRSDDPRLDTLFYTALYHCAILPSLDMDRDGRYRSPNHRIYHSHDHTVYTNFSLWDTFRGLHPLFTIIHRALTKEILETFLDRYRHTGNLPVFELSGNDLPVMIGFHSLPVIADAWAKGISVEDTLLMLEAMKELARLPYGTRETYKVFGYLPYDYTYQSVSRTLEFAYDDWCVARVARDLDTAAWRYYSERSHFYRNLFDSTSGFMRPRDSRRRWLTPFDPLTYTRNYTQANAWQYTTFVPHDMAGLIALMGGDKTFEAWLDRFFDTPNPSTYQGRRSSWMIGQYYHGNEPSHHVAYLYTYAGVPWKTQRMVRRILTTQYRTGPAGLAGNDDAGQMSAWYVLSAMGFYSVTPGTGQYVLGSPLFREATIHLEHGRTFRIVARNNGPDRPYIRSVTLNGRPLSRSYLLHEEIMRGGTLAFMMSDRPDTGRAAPSPSRPFTLPYRDLPMPVIRVEGGHLPPDGLLSYERSCRVTITSPERRARLRFTCDGSDPLTGGRWYVRPLMADSTCLLRVRPFLEGRRPGYASWVHLRRLNPLPSLPVTAPRPGLRYRYRKVWACRHPDQQEHYPVVREGVVPAVGTAMGFPMDDKHAVTFTGYLLVPREGIYTFRLFSEDASRLRVDGITLIINEGTDRSARIALRRGYHSLEVLHVQVGGTPRLRLTWSGPDTPEGPVPPQLLFH